MINVHKYKLISVIIEIYFSGDTYLELVGLDIFDSIVRRQHKFEIPSVRVFFKFELFVILPDDLHLLFVVETHIDVDSVFEFYRVFAFKSDANQHLDNSVAGFFRDKWEELEVSVDGDITVNVNGVSVQLSALLQIILLVVPVTVKLPREQC